MHAVVYISTQNFRFTDQSLLEVLEQSRRNNLAANITGLLLFKDGNFMQILEGVKQDIDAVLVKIRADVRHRGLIVLMDEETPNRLFSEWSMAFKKLSKDTVLEIPGYRDYSDLPLDSAKLSSDSASLLRFISIFKMSVA